MIMKKMKDDCHMYRWETRPPETWAWDGAYDGMADGKEVVRASGLRTKSVDISLAAVEFTYSFPRSRTNAHSNSYDDDYFPESSRDTPVSWERPCPTSQHQGEPTNVDVRERAVWRV